MMTRMEAIRASMAAAFVTAVGLHAKQLAAQPEERFTLDDLRDLVFGTKTAESGLPRGFCSAEHPDRHGLELERFGGTVLEAPLGYADGVYIHLTTEKSVFRIAAIPPSPKERGYLGAVATRKACGGGRDLYDGRFTRKTWNGILSDIVAFELI